MKSYSIITKIHNRKFQNKKILLVGAGKMASQYASTLKNMNINDVYVISKNKQKTKKFCEKYNFNLFDGSLNNLKNYKMDLIIVTPSIDVTLKLLDEILKNVQQNVLVEKPVSLYSNKIKSCIKKAKNSRVRIGYNRLTYPNYIKLKELISRDGGITSCKFTITNRNNKMDFSKGVKDYHNRWGVYNGIHVISMIYDLIGKPKKISSYQTGELEWHNSGSIFVGSGISEKNIPFSYHADWNSAGRWGIEIMTRKNAYRLISLEELFKCKIDTDNWEKIEFKKSFPNVKQGLAEEIAVMLDKSLERKIKLVNLEIGYEIVEFGERIFGYN